jgi:hypothetical protein
MLHKQEVTSKLHKSTNYKSNYTSTMYMKVNTRLCCAECKPPRRWRRQCWYGDFLPRFTWLPPSYVPIVSTTHLMVRRLIGITRQARTSGTARTYPESEGSSMTRSIRVALRNPHGVSTIHLTNPPPEHRTIFSRASTESQATKPSRRWQPLRVTSITGLQLDHLVPLNATS